MSFEILVRLSERRLVGLEALDRRRALGLPDGDKLVLAAPGKAYEESIAETMTCDVTEPFARAWFSPNAMVSEVVVTDEMLTPGDLAPCKYSAVHAGFRLDLPPERIKELYVAARFRGCREQVRRLKERVAELEATQATRDWETCDE